MSLILFDKFIEPDYNDSGSRYITENYDKLLKYVSMKLGDKNRATILLSDVFVCIRRMEVNYTWKVNEMYLEYIMYNYINKFIKSHKYKNDNCDYGSLKDLKYRDANEIDDTNSSLPDNSDDAIDKVSAKQIIDKYLNKDDEHSRLIIYTVTNAEKLIDASGKSKIHKSMWECLSKEELSDLKELLEYASKNNVEELL